MGGKKGGKNPYEEWLETAKLNYSNAGSTGRGDAKLVYEDMLKLSLKWEEKILHLSHRLNQLGRKKKNTRKPTTE